MNSSFMYLAFLGISILILVSLILRVIHYFCKKKESSFLHALFVGLIVVYIIMDAANKYMASKGRPEAFFALWLLLIACCGVVLFINSIKNILHRGVIIGICVIGLGLSSLFFSSYYSEFTLFSILLFVPELIFALKKKGRSSNPEAVRPALWARILFGVLLCVWLIVTLLESAWIYCVFPLLIYTGYIILCGNKQIVDQLAPFLFLPPLLYFLVMLGHSVWFNGIGALITSFGTYFGFSGVALIAFIVLYIFSFLYLLKGNTDKRPLIAATTIVFVAVFFLVGAARGAMTSKYFFRYFEGHLVFNTMMPLLATILFPFGKFAGFSKWAIPKNTRSELSIEQNLIELNQRYANGFLSEEEYRARRAELLRRL